MALMMMMYLMKVQAAAVNQSIHAAELLIHLQLAAPPAWNYPGFQSVNHVKEARTSLLLVEITSKPMKILLSMTCNLCWSSCTHKFS